MTSLYSVKFSYILIDIQKKKIVIGSSSSSDVKTLINSLISIIIKVIIIKKSNLYLSLGRAVLFNVKKIII